MLSTIWSTNFDIFSQTYLQRQNMTKIKLVKLAYHLFAIIFVKYSPPCTGVDGFSNTKDEPCKSTGSTNKKSLRQH